MKAKTILLATVVISVLLSVAVYAQDETTETREKNFGMGVYYVTYPGEDVNGWGISGHYLKENLMFDLGWTLATQDTFVRVTESWHDQSGDLPGFISVGNLWYFDASYLWRQTNDEDEYAGFFGGLGLEAQLGEGTQYGGVAQLGYESPGGLMLRLKYAMLSDSINAYYLQIGQSF